MKDKKGRTIRRVRFVRDHGTSVDGAFGAGEVAALPEAVAADCVRKSAAVYDDVEKVSGKAASAKPAKKKADAAEDPAADAGPVEKFRKGKR